MTLLLHIFGLPIWPIEQTANGASLPYRRQAKEKSWTVLAVWRLIPALGSEGGMAVVFLSFTGEPGGFSRTSAHSESQRKAMQGNALEQGGINHVESYAVSNSHFDKISNNAQQP
jgi:hypothetical protein